MIGSITPWVLSSRTTFCITTRLLGTLTAKYGSSSSARDAAAAQKELADYMTGLVQEKEKSPENDVSGEEP